MCSSTDTASNSRAYSSTDTASNSKAYSSTDTGSNDVREKYRRNLQVFVMLEFSQCKVRSV